MFLVILFSVEDIRDEDDFCSVLKAFMGFVEENV